MQPVVGVFNSRKDAEQAFHEMRSLGLEKNRIDLLSPGTRRVKTGAVPVTDTEQPGIGKALGGAVGGSVGGAAGAELGAVAASFLFPRVGPRPATGISPAPLLGTGGPEGSASRGNALREAILE